MANTAVDITEKGQDSNLEQQPLTNTEVATITSETVTSQIRNIAAVNSNLTPTEDFTGLEATYQYLQTDDFTETRPIPSVQNVQARPNPLEPYATYTYGISLHLLKPSEYNTMIVDGAPYQATNVLIASGGRRAPRDLESTFTRNPKFNDDFYIDNLRVNTVIGMNSINRGTNVIEISFTIYEPYGMTLIERLIAVGLDADPESKSYIELPYVLQIDFFGNTTDGQVVKIPQTKIIPIKIIEIKFRVSEKGAEYNCRAVPFGHQAYNDTMVAAPVNLEVTAGTVGMFFADTLDSTLVRDTEERNTEIERRELDLQEARRGSISSQVSNSTVEEQRKLLEQARREPFIVNSYVSGLNDYLKYLANKNLVEDADEIVVDIHQDIAKAKIVVPTKIDARKTPMVDPSKNKETLTLDSDVTTGTKQLQQSFSINAGTSIIDIINQVIRNSDYILNQIMLDGAKQEIINTINPQELLNQSKKVTPLKWFKITPSIKVKKYDKKRNTYSKIITYSVTPYLIYNQKFKLAPMAAPPYWVKEYNYLYMGNNPAKSNMGPNKDILRFDIQFDALFYTAYSTLRNNFEKTNVTLTESDSPLVIPGDKLPATSNINKQVFVSHQIQQLHLDGGQDERRIIAGDLSKSIYNSSKDLISVKLDIIGDPEYIKQDDILYNTALREKNKNPQSEIVDITNSLVTDVQEVFVRLNFRTPSDINLKTGLPMNKSLNLNNETYTINSTFSGIYRILTVTSEFNSGKFTQSLDMIRMFNQEEDYIQNPNLSSDNRQAVSQSQVRAIDNAIDLADVPNISIDQSMLDKSNALAKLSADSSLLDNNQVLAKLSDTVNINTEILDRNSTLTGSIVDNEILDRNNALARSVSRTIDTVQTQIQKETNSSLAPLIDQGKAIARDTAIADEMTIDQYINQSAGVFSSPPPNIT